MKKLISQLQSLDIEGCKPTVIVNDEGVFISGEGDMAQMFLSYYGENLGYGCVIPDMFIHEKIEKIAKNNGGNFEWQNPAMIKFIKD